VELHDLKTEEEWQELLDALSCSTKMAACLTDREGNIIQSRGDRNPLCAQIRKNKESLTFICSQTNRSMLAEVLQTGEPVVDLGEAGLCRMVVPIIVEGEMIGMVTACGAALAGEEIEEFLIAQQIGISEGEVVKLAKSAPTCKEEDIGEVARCLFEEIRASMVGAPPLQDFEKEGAQS
jgi:ligand-binding sensor protein